ncbi:MAG: LytTR family transcriptional regulator [Enterovirga sp.]|nr:LytTR family transcriptional regulator [Enterovirga sp.]
MLGLPLTFLSPLVLAGLAALPAIWLLLRVTPPQPRRIDFPPLRILADLLPRQESPARTPWWLLAIRLLVAALLIGAASGPLWNPGAGGGRGPLLLILDSGFPAAQDWRTRQAYAVERAEGAVRDGRPTALLATGERPVALEALAPAAALERVRAVKPQPWLVDRRVHLDAVVRFVRDNPGAEVVWISDGVAGGDDRTFADALAAAAASVTVVQPPRAPALALAGAETRSDRLATRVVRAEPNGRDAGTLRALDQKGLPVADAPFVFGTGATDTEASFQLPMELRNTIARIEMLGESSAGAVLLLDERGKRRRIGLVSGSTADQAQPLLAPTYYLARALGPYGEVRESHGGVADAVTQLLDQQVSVLVLADVGTLDRDTHAKVLAFVDRGGLLLRFAGTRLAAGNDDLVPVRLRRGGRNLGGALSWDAPRTLAPFGRESPFFGLEVPRDLGVRRQILAEPDGELGRKTWAALEDGTPIVTADRRGKGLIALVHVTADASWSNLPLTGLFVDMLRRTVALSGLADTLGAEAKTEVETAAPTRVLDGFGTLVGPPPTARPVPRSYSDRARPEHPPGFYGPADASLAVNALVPGDRLAPVQLGALAGRVAPLAAAATLDIRAPLLTLAILLLLIDTLASLWLGGHLARLRLRRRLAPAALALGLALPLGLASPDPASAQTASGRTALEAALVTRLAYVVTGDAQIDATSKAGLTGLTQILAARTAMEPGDPIGVDLSRDELAFVPLLYVPIAPNQPVPTDAAIRRLDAFMKNGGTVIFDTRDALNARPGGEPTPETAALRRMLATLDVPELEPVPRDHVLTKTFYLLDRFPGRYATGQTWVEALPPAADGERRPARAGDGVSPVVITSNDLAAAWAVGRSGEPLYPVVGADPRQREMALRGGVNLVMYTLTGNYKADQVHVPALLERLGQ